MAALDCKADCMYILLVDKLALDGIDYNDLHFIECSLAPKQAVYINPYQLKDMALP